jgi:hypothetical protein
MLLGVMVLLLVLFLKKALLAMLEAVAERKELVEYVVVDQAVAQVDRMV